MRPLHFFVIAALALALPPVAVTDEESFRAALLDLPPKHLADIPLADRAKLLKTVDGDKYRFQAANGWLHWFSDGSSVRATSMAWAKELPREGKSALVFVHKARPFADGTRPAVDQTAVLERTDKGWIDVTKKVMPADIDLTMHFRSRQQDTIIEVAAWQEIDRADGKGKAFVFGARILDLHWNGERFVSKEPESEKLTKN